MKMLPKYIYARYEKEVFRFKTLRFIQMLESSSKLKESEEEQIMLEDYGTCLGEVLDVKNWDRQDIQKMLEKLKALE
jgi:hypothetical protein